MIRLFLAVGAALLLAPTIGLAQAAQQRRAAEAFMTAVQTLDHRTALLLMDSKVQIQFQQPPGGDGPGLGQGQPFVIGYLDGLFGADRELRVDGDSPQGDAVRFRAHDLRSLDPFVIDVVVHGGRVVRVTVIPGDQTGPAALAQGARPASRTPDSALKQRETR
jgi:hypothetical protein